MEGVVWLGAGRRAGKELTIRTSMCKFSTPCSLSAVAAETAGYCSAALRGMSSLFEGDPGQLLADLALD